ncbi:MAG: tetratricopeptide repeat protein [Candidatus Goldiibacteriota bacterium]
MRKITAAAFALVLFLCVSCGDNRQNNGETPERLFNMATEAMYAGDDMLAIELYYNLLENHPKFKYGRDEALFRLGNMLYKTGRFEESEKTFSRLLDEYPGYGRSQRVYEKLLHIYVHEYNDEAGAQKIRDAYAEKFGAGATLKKFDKTVSILSFNERNASEILSLRPDQIEIGSAGASDSFDKEFFPVRNYIKQNVRSPDHKYAVYTETAGKKQYLYIKEAETGKKKKVPDSRNGFAPVWSWGGRYLLFTVKRNAERDIRLYSLEKNRTVTLFTGRNIEPLTCFSPDSSKIMFIYAYRPWVMNKEGSSIALLSRNIRVSDLGLAAWSRAGDKIMLRSTKENSRYYTFALKRKELKILK